METPELNAIDRHFAALLKRLAPSPELQLAAELVSRFRADGHICLPLRDVNAAMLRRAGISAPFPNLKTWIEKLRLTAMVGAEENTTPLVLDQRDRLYLRRYWKYERDLAANLRARLERPPHIEKDFARQFKKIVSSAAPLQQLAAFIAATSNLTIISGAPGTGKTRTVALICALLLASAKEVKIALTAPTGKAAARLKESLTTAKTSLQVAPEILAHLPENASTIQRLLGSVRDSVKFRHHAGNPLSADAVIVDEASMIDLALLAKLADAVRPDARLILVGDKDQLASVEAGSAFRDICVPGVKIGISETVGRDFEKVSGLQIAETQRPIAPIQNCLVELQQNFRFAGGEGIAELSRAINAGDACAALGVLRKGGAQIAWRKTPPAKNFAAELRKAVLMKFEALRNITDPAAALQRLSNFIVLCALRRGPFGAETVDQIIEKFLLDAREPRYFAGQPLMIVSNDYDNDLFNGDLGIVLGHGDKQRVYFSGEEGTTRSFTPARLPEHETAFALTVHKSQGSEFQEALVILPDQDSPVLTRELLYTAITRVRQRVEIWAPEGVLEQTIARVVRRGSGLGDALWAGK